MLFMVLGFGEGSVVSFLGGRSQVFSRVGVIMNSKRSDVLLDNKLSVMSLYLFLFFVEKES